MRGEKVSKAITLMPGIWYGSEKDIKEIDKIKENLVKVTTERECILSIVEILKAGDLSVKKLLIQLMNSTKDDDILNLCIRGFCDISTHEDLKDSNNLVFLSNTSDFAAFTFAASAPSTLSYEVVPYLLAMLKEWEDTYVEETIKDSLDKILNYSEELNDDAEVDEIGQLFIEYTKDEDRTIYYYEQEPVFPGNLTKQLMERAYISLNTGSEVEMYTIPSLLSIWSGIKCPVEYDMVMNSEEMEKLIGYIDELIKIPWIKGRKYFYAKEV